MCGYIYIYSNKYQYMLVLSDFSNQDTLVATSADIHISFRHSHAVGAMSGAACPAVGVTQSSGGGLLREPHGLARPVGRLAVHPAGAGA